MTFSQFTASLDHHHCLHITSTMNSSKLSHHHHDLAQKMPFWCHLGFICILIIHHLLHTFTHNNTRRAQTMHKNMLFGPKPKVCIFFYITFMSFKCFFFVFVFVFVFNWLPHPGAPTFTHNNTRRAQTTHFDLSFGPQVSIFSDI